jgi:PilZ domain
MPDVDRRRSDRRQLHRVVRVGTPAEALLPAARLMDVSDEGLLVAFPEPIGLSLGGRVCVSLPSADGAVHLLARVARVARGADFHTYVGLAIEPKATGSDDVFAVGQTHRWRLWLDGRTGDWVESAVEGTAAGSPSRREHLSGCAFNQSYRSC